MTKKEIQMLNREKVKLSDQHRGIKDMRRLPDAIVVVDAQYEDTAIKEAKRLDIPVIAIVDSNTDPNKVDYAIPANDDSMRTIQLIIASLADSILEAKSSGKDTEKNENTTTKIEELIKVLQKFKKSHQIKRSPAMSSVDAKLVKSLRDRTGAGMMDCKKALVESNGDLDSAVDFLRKSGIAKAEKRFRGRKKD